MAHFIVSDYGRVGPIVVLVSRSSAEAASVIGLTTRIGSRSQLPLPASVGTPDADAVMRNVRRSYPPKAGNRIPLERPVRRNSRNVTDIPPDFALQGGHRNPRITQVQTTSFRKRANGIDDTSVSDASMIAMQSIHLPW